MGATKRAVGQLTARFASHTRCNATEVSMNTAHLLGIWAILSILWVTSYVAVFALVGEHVAFERVVSDILTPITALLVIGGTVVKIFRGFRKPR